MRSRFRESRMLTENLVAELRLFLTSFLPLHPSLRFTILFTAFKPVRSMFPMLKRDSKQAKGIEILLYRRFFPAKPQMSPPTRVLIDHTWYWEWCTIWRLIWGWIRTWNVSAIDREGQWVSDLNIWPLRLWDVEASSQGNATGSPTREKSDYG